MITSNNLSWYDWTQYLIIAILMGAGTGGMIGVYYRIDWLDVFWETLLTIGHLIER